MKPLRRLLQKEEDVHSVSLVSGLRSVRPQVSVFLAVNDFISQSLSVHICRGTAIKGFYRLFSLFSLTCTDKSFALPGPSARASSPTELSASNINTRRSSLPPFLPPTATPALVSVPPWREAFPAAPPVAPSSAPARPPLPPVPWMRRSQSRSMRNYRGQDIGERTTMVYYTKGEGNNGNMGNMENTGTR